MRFKLPPNVNISRDRGMVRVRLGQRFTGTTAIIRRFPNQTAAIEWIQAEMVSRRVHGQGSSTLSAKQLAEAIEAFSLLDEASKRTETELGLLDAVKYFLARGAPSGGLKTVNELIAAWIDAKKAKGVSRDYLGGVRSTYDRFAAEFGPYTLHEITPEECEKWVNKRKISVNSKIHYIKDLTTLFSWAEQKKWLAENPWKSVELPKSAPIEVGTLSVAQATRLLETAASEEHTPMLAYVVLGLFTGARTKELQRLQWEAIRTTSRPIVDFAASVTKTQERRTVPLTDEAVKWLSLCAQKEGPIAPTNAEDRFRRLYQTAGITSYPKNAMRHSFASYLFSRSNNAHVVATSLGHTNLHTLKKHYVETCLPEEADAYFAISP